MVMVKEVSCIAQSSLFCWRKLEPAHIPRAVITFAVDTAKSRLGMGLRPTTERNSGKVTGITSDAIFGARAIPAPVPMLQRVLIAIRRSHFQ